jgi:hypothetical protein
VVFGENLLNKRNKLALKILALKIEKLALKILAPKIEDLAPFSNFLEYSFLHIFFYIFHNY